MGLFLLLLLLQLVFDGFSFFRMFLLFATRFFLALLFLHLGFEGLPLPRPFLLFFTRRRLLLAPLRFGRDGLLLSRLSSITLTRRFRRLSFATCLFLLFLPLQFSLLRLLFPRPFSALSIRFVFRFLLFSRLSGCLCPRPIAIFLATFFCFPVFTRIRWTGGRIGRTLSVSTIGTPVWFGGR